jgi:hypothetical protein
VTAPYTPSDWQRDWDDGAHLACPRCGSADDYGARQVVLADRSFRKFRGCKRCGLFQEADGVSPPYQTVLLVHECGASIAADSQCKACGMRPRKGTSGRHACPRVVREGESITCAECGLRLGPAHARPWPEPGPWPRA